MRKFHGIARNFAEILRKLLCNDPFPNDPTSELHEQFGTTGPDRESLLRFFGDRTLRLL